MFVQETEKPLLPFFCLLLRASMREVSIDCLDSVFFYSILSFCLSFFFFRSAPHLLPHQIPTSLPPAMPSLPLLFPTSPSSSPWHPSIYDFTTNSEIICSEGVPCHDGKGVEYNIQQILDMVTSADAGGVKVEENSLLLDFQRNSVQELLMSSCLIDPTSSFSFRTPILCSESSSFPPHGDSMMFSFPLPIIPNPRSTRNIGFYDDANEEASATDATCELVPFTVSPPSSHAHHQSSSHPELKVISDGDTLLVPPCPSDSSLIPLEPCFGALADSIANIDIEDQILMVDPSKKTRLDEALQSAAFQYPDVSLPLPLSSLGSSCVTHVDSSIDHDIVAQESFGNPSLGGYPKPGIALTDCCCDLLGSTKHQHHHQYTPPPHHVPLLHHHHQDLEPPSSHTSLDDGSIHLNMLHGSTDQTHSLDTFRLLNISRHHDRNGEFTHLFLYGDGGHRSELGNPEVDLKDLSLNVNGVDVLLSDVQFVSRGICQYTKDEKEKRIGRYRQKRNERNFSKKIKYACRKTLADNRPRIKGRFAKMEDAF